MLHTQHSLTVEAHREAVRSLHAGQVFSLNGAGGELSVLAGRVWLTRVGDPEDHLLAPGQSLRLEASRGALIEAWDEGTDARIEWHPRSHGQRLADGIRQRLVRCWELVPPGRRIGVGIAASLAALLVGAALFGPVSAQRVRELVVGGQPVLHNAAGAATGATLTRGGATGGSDSRRGPSVLAQEAGGGAAGPA